MIPTEKASEKYIAMDTKAVIERLMQRSFIPVDWNKTDKKHGKHIMTFKHYEERNLDVGNGDIITPTIQLLNSNNRRLSFMLNIGFIRLVCSNGLRAYESAYETRTKHIGKKPEFIIDEFLNSYEERVSNRFEMIKKMDIMETTPEITKDLVETALKAREYDAPEKIQTIITSLDDIVQQVSIPQRRFDKSNTLWKVFNTIQENVESGNYKAPTHTKKGLIMRKVKPIKSMEKKEIFNQKLWEQVATFVA